MDSVTVEKIKADLRRHEGEVLKIYKDTEGFKTAGIGHLLSKNDPEFHQPVGTAISKSRCEQWFAHDVLMALKDAQKLVPEFDRMQDQIQRVLVNMTFNMGLDRVKKFKNFLSAVSIGDYEGMIQEMKNSKWYIQVPNRVNDLIKLVREAETDNNNALRG